MHNDKGYGKAEPALKNRSPSAWSLFFKRDGLRAEDSVSDTYSLFDSEAMYNFSIVSSKIAEAYLLTQISSAYSAEVGDHLYLKLVVSP